jgi:hypothetical protein
LKKRSKKLLLFWVLATAMPRPAGADVFFASFFSKKEALT